MDTISGYVEHIVFRNEESGYTVFQLASDEYDTTTCVGKFALIGEGEFLEIEGDFVDHPTYGPQMRVSVSRLKEPEDAAAIERYLGSGAIKGIGQKLAAAIIKKFGDDTFRVIEEEPERLAEVRGISLNKARDISEQIDDKKDMFILYFRFVPKQAFVLILTPIACALKIPYVIPVALGLAATPISMVSVGCGVIIYYIIHYATVYAAGVSASTDTDAVSKVTYFAQNVLQNKQMWVTVMAFAIVVAVVYAIRRQSIDHSCCKWVHNAVGKNQNPIAVLYYAQLAAYLLLAFFTTWFSNPTTWFWLAATTAMALPCWSRFLCILSSFTGISQEASMS